MTDAKFHRNIIQNGRLEAVLGLFFSLSLHPLCGGGDLLFLPHRPPPPLVSALTQKRLLRLFPNIYSMHTGPGEIAW